MNMNKLLKIQRGLGENELCFVISNKYVYYDNNFLKYYFSKNNKEIVIYTQYATWNYKIIDVL
jgi:hypothetical protein